MNMLLAYVAVYWIVMFALVYSSGRFKWTFLPPVAFVTWPLAVPVMLLTIFIFYLYDLGERKRRVLGREPQTHDYTIKRWGHDITFEVLEEGARLAAFGWGLDIVKGDYILLRIQAGATTRYRVDSIYYFVDPEDQWSANLSFAPRIIRG